MNGADVNQDKVMIEVNVHPIYRELTEGADPTRVPFRMMKDVFLWAAVLGYAEGRRRPLEGKSIGILRWSPFTPQVDVPLLRAIAVASAGDLTTIQQQGMILRIAEEYANAGIHILRDHLLEQDRQPLWHLLELLAREQARRDPGASYENGST